MRLIGAILWFEANGRQLVGRQELNDPLVLVGGRDNSSSWLFKQLPANWPFTQLIV